MQERKTNMKETRMMMGMTIVVDIADATAANRHFREVFDYFNHVDEIFSTYKNESEISRINRGEISAENWSADIKTIFKLSEETKKQTGGFFDITRTDGTFDPSGIVKGWAIFNAAEIITKAGFQNFYIDAGGDIEARGKNKEGKDWKIGIRDPFGNSSKIVKIVYASGRGVATSGTYVRGQHIYNPYDRGALLEDVVSLTVVGPNVYEVDRFATAAFAMGRRGIEFIENLSGFEGYQIDKDGIAVETSGFEKYTKEDL